MSPKILCLGEPLMEFNQQPDGNYLPGFGGDTSNCAIAAARQGVRVGYITHLGADKFGNAFIDFWHDESLDTTTVRQVQDAHTGIYFVTHSDQGHEFSYFREGSASSRMTPEDLPLEAIANAKILHVSGISQAISDAAADTVSSAIEYAGKSGCRVSYDTNLRLKLWPIEKAKPIIHAAMSKCDIALPSLEDAIELTGLTDPDGIADFYLELGASIVALTLGMDGALVATTEERQIIGGYEVEAVDATAAGDTFDGAFLARLVTGDSPFDAAQYANAAAALSTQKYGAVPSIPHHGAVKDLMAKG